MDEATRPVIRDLNGVLITVIGMILVITFAVWFAGEARPVHDRSNAQRQVDHTQAELDATRGRAIRWATPECKARVVRAVAHANAERAVVDAAWAACPDHPDALD